MNRSQAAPLGVFLAVAAVFSPLLWAGFVNWDDPFVLLDNPRLRALTPENLRWMATSFHMTTYQPLTWLLYALLHAVFGLSPAAYHAAGLLLHAANAALLALVIARLDGKARAAGAAAALLWALHPLQVQAAAWVSALNDVWSVFLGLLSTLAWLRWAERRRPADYALALVLFAAAGLARWKALCFPALWLLLDAGPLRRPAKDAVPEKVPFYLVAAALAWATAGAKALYSPGVSPWAAPSDGAAQAFFYLRRLLWPAGFSPLYSREFVAFPWSAAALGAVSAGLLSLAPKRRGPLLAWLGYLVCVAPVSFFATRGPALAADHYAYLAFMPFAVLLALGLKAPRAWAALLLAAVGLGAAAQSRARAWTDSVSLWTSALDCDPASPVARPALAAALVEQGRRAEALPLLGEHLARFPEDEAARAQASRLRGRDPRAAALAEKASESFASGRFGEAASALERAAALEPAAPELALNLGLALYRAGRTRPALKAFERAVALDPQDAEARNGLGTVLIKLGRIAEAEAQFAEASRLSPGSERFRENLARARALSVSAKRP